MRLSLVALLLAAGVLPAGAVGRCDDAIVTVNTAATAVEVGAAGVTTACTFMGFDGVKPSRLELELCIVGLELVCAATVAEAAAIAQLWHACTDSLPSLGCGKSVAASLASVALLTATCTTYLTACRDLPVYNHSSPWQLSDAACLAAEVAGPIEVFFNLSPFSDQVCDTVHACNNCSAPGYSGFLGDPCSVDFLDDHPECRQFGPDVSCCRPNKEGMSCTYQYDPSIGAPTPITSYGEGFCCPDGATVAQPCPPAPVRYKCIGGKCVPNATGVSKDDCEAACGSLVV